VELQLCAEMQANAADVLGDVRSAVMIRTIAAASFALIAITILAHGDGPLLVIDRWSGVDYAKVDCKKLGPKGIRVTAWRRDTDLDTASGFGRGADGEA
jgi:hypothetical protein